MKTYQGYGTSPAVLAHILYGPNAHYVEIDA